MSSFPLRQLRAGDAEQVASLFVEAFGDARAVDPEEIRSWLGNQEIESEWLQVVADGAEIVGYGDIWIVGDEIALDVAAPGHWATFFEWAEASARDRGVPRVRITSPPGHELASVAEARGYRPWRSSFTMQIDLEARPAEPPLPTGLTCALMTPPTQRRSGHS
jgi:hypothetical protein